jgi:hypothetical protein
MTRPTLTARPRVPLLVQAAMAGSLAASPIGCGDDNGTSDTGNSSDVAPTAGECVHASLGPEDCATTDPTTVGTSVGTSSNPTTTDQAPTIPCAHDDGSSPECMTTSGPSDSTATDSGGTGSGSGTGAESGSSSGTGG